MSSDNINYDLLAATILRQSQTMSSNLTNLTDDTMETTQPGVQNQSDTSNHVHLVAMQQTAASASSENQPRQNIADLASALLQQEGQGSVSRNTSFTKTANKNPRGSSLHLTNAAKRLLQATLAPATRKAYLHSWQIFLAWAGSISLPVYYFTICNFIGHLFEIGYSLSSIASHISALTDINKVLKLPDPAQCF